MSEVTVRRLSATVTDWPDPDQVPRMLANVAGSRLDDALRSSTLPDGEWCVRRVDLAARLDPERPAGALETDWADRIVVALRQSLADASRDVVRYERHEEALDDLLEGLALGRFDHLWAWQLVGLVQPDDPAAEEDPQRLCSRVLGRLPHGGARSVSRLVRRVGPIATHRLLGIAGWAEVAARAATEAGATLDRLAGTADAPAAVVEPAALGEPAPARLARTLGDASFLFASLRASGLRMPDLTRRHWAVLVLAETDPATLGRPGAADVVRAVAGLLDRPVPRGLGTAAAPPAPPRGTPGPGDTTRTSAPPVPAATGPSAAPSLPAPSGRPADTPAQAVGDPGAPSVGPSIGPSDGPSDTARDQDAPRPQATGAAPGDAEPGPTTAWGGLLFLLNTADDAGVPKTLEEGPLLPRPAAWLLAQLATRLVPAVDDDPAVLALGGLDPALAAAQPAADTATAAALDRCAARWREVTAARLRSAAASPQEWPRSDEALVRRLARRRAVVVGEPGWVEVRLRLDEVDVDVRRAGLDLDPGWVWWLGQVVRFTHE